MKNYNDEADYAEAEAERRSQGLTAQLDRLDKSTSLLYDRFDRLENRLHPVLSPPRPRPSAADSAEPELSGSAITSVVVGVRERLELLAEKLSDLTDQLDL